MKALFLWCNCLTPLKNLRHSQVLQPNSSMHRKKKMDREREKKDTSVFASCQFQEGNFKSLHGNVAEKICKGQRLALICFLDKICTFKQQNNAEITQESQQISCNDAPCITKWAYHLPILYTISPSLLKDFRYTQNLGYQHLSLLNRSLSSFWATTSSY